MQETVMALRKNEDIDTEDIIKAVTPHLNSNWQFTWVGQNSEGGCSLPSGFTI
jgi:hypothetical protein